MGPNWGPHVLPGLGLAAVFIAVFIQAIYGLDITVQPKDQVVRLYDPVWIDCVADGPEPVTYIWKVNNILLPLSENQVIYDNGTLHIRRLANDDMGVYLCTATSGGENVNSRQTTLEIAYIDTIFETSPVASTLMLGDRLVLSCSIESLPAATITWTLDGAPVTKGTVQVSDYGEHILTLFPALYQEEGEYKCKATNPMIPGVIRYSLGADIVIKGQPVFLSSLKSAFVPLGYQATFDCGFYGNPKPSVSWLVHEKNLQGDVTSQEIAESSKYSVYENGTFLIHNVSEADVSTYTCKVENEFGAMSESAQLYVTGSPTLPYFTSQPSNISVLQEADASFSCQCSGNPKPTQYWTKAGTRLVSSTRLSVDTNGKLELYDVQSSDMDWYTCVCRNQEGIVNQSVYLDVQVVPAIISPPSSSFVLEGDPVTLTCVASGNPSPRITWVTPQYGLIQSSIPGYNLGADGSLTVDVVSVEDTGTYTCTAVSNIGTVTASASLTVEASPQFSLLPTSQSVTEGDRAYFHCQARGLPTPTYLWTKDGGGQISSTVFTQIFLNNTLAIHKVRKEDAGIYRCLATNKHGQITAVASLTVTVPPYFTMSPTNISVQEGSTVKLYCVALGEPVPVQRWEKDGRLLQDDNVQILPDGSQLTITDIRQNQFGQYTCLASSIAGTRSASAWVTALDVPVLIIGPRNIIVNQSETLTLQCQGEALEIPSVRWYRQQQGELTLLQDNLRTKIQNGELTIKAVLNSDEGFYKCVITNSAGEITATAFVDVQVPPVIVSTDSPQSAVSQSVVVLSCQSSGDPAPSWSWTNPHGNMITSNSAYQVRDNTLQILSANQITDMGQWVCTACNLLGCDSETVELIIEGVPYIRSFHGNKKSGYVTLTCEATGIPNPTVTLTSEGERLGSSEVEHTLVIPEMTVKPEYRCEARNPHGVSTKTVTDPVRIPEIPSVTATEPGQVTLTWPHLDDSSNLPLIGYMIQLTSDIDNSWQDANIYLVSELDIHTQQEVNMTGLLPFTHYAFRVAAINILGTGQYSESSSRVQTLSGVSSPPTKLVALEMRDSIFVITWDPPANLNGPVSQIVYQYKVTKPLSAEGSADVIHSQGTVLSNQSRHVEITDLTDPVVYTFSIWAHNTVLDIQGEPATLNINRTASPAADPHSKTVPGDKDVQPEKLIIILCGVIGGIILIVIIIFVIVHIRHNKKSETHSFTRPRYSLDQFYMENPKDLYDKTEKGRRSMRRRSHGFYKFDNDDSFHSSNPSVKERRYSSRHSIISSPENVLLVAKNPLYEEDHESTISIPAKFSIKRLSLQHEIEFPNGHMSQREPLMSPQTGSDVTDDVIDVQDGSKRPNADALTPLSVKNLEEDLQRIYGDSAPSSTRASCETEPGIEHIYSSIHSDSQRSRSHDSTSSSSPCGTFSSANGSVHKPPVRVINPSQLRANKPQTLELQTYDSCADQGTSLPVICDEEKQFDRVVSPDHLENEPKKEQVALVKPYSAKDDSESCDSSNEPDEMTSDYNKCLVTEEINGDIHVLTESEQYDPLTEDGSGELIYDISAKEKCETDTLRTKPDDIWIDDNFLNAEEIKKEVTAAALY